MYYLGGLNVNRDKLIQMISESIVFESPDADTPPMDYFNHWIQTTGVKINDPCMASWLLDFIKEALSSNRDLLSYFI